MPKHYTREEITGLLGDLEQPIKSMDDAIKVALLQSDFKDEAPAIIRQLLEEIEALKVKLG